MIGLAVLSMIIWSSASMWLLILLGIVAAAFIFHKIKLRKVYHEKKEYESRSLELEALLYHSKQLMTRLNYEIRNPLNGVMGLSSILQETSLTEEQREYVQSIRNCSMDVIKALDTRIQAAGVVNNTEETKATESRTAHSMTPSKKLSVEFATHYPLKILVAEDDPMNQQLAIMILKRLGYSADIAPNGREVLEIVSERKYSLILMDVQMPEMNGLEATRMIRLCLAVQPVIIAMTANAMEGDKEACLASGMNDYISKPVSTEELVEKLEKWAVTLKDVKENT